MADDIKIGLNGKPLTDAAKPALEALKQLAIAAENLDKLDMSRARKEVREMATTVKELAASADTEMKKFAAGIAAGVTKAGKDAKAKAREAGREVGKDFKEALEKEASSARVSVSAPRIAGANGLGISVSGKGAGSSADVLATQREIMAATGGMTTVQIKQWDDAQKAIDAGRVAAATRSSKLASSLAADGIREDARFQGERVAAAKVQAKLMDGVAADNVREEVRRQGDLVTTGRARSKVLDGVAADSVREERRRQGDLLVAGKAQGKLLDDVATNTVREEVRRQGEIATALRTSQRAQKTVRDGLDSDNIREEQYRQKLRAGAVADAIREDVRFEKERAAAAVVASRVGARAGAAGVVSEGTAAKQAAKAASNELADAEQRLTKHSNDLHSATRGLASGFNAMWLTWGALAPLMAGAAISHAFTSAIKKGSEFGQTLATIQNLAEQTTPEMRGINTAILDLGKGGSTQGPQAIADALKTLALAGLNARDQLAALKPALNFSIAGDVALNQGAETLIAVSTAFGYTANDLSVVGDVIAKAAAVSMSSVTDMSAAFRVASAVAQQYGVSLTDAATSLSVLAQINIKGTAAGTAMRQMYSELFGSSKKARAILKDVLQIDAFDGATNAMKPMIQIYAELSAGLDRYSAKSQQMILQNMGNERGTKSLAANLTAFRSEVTAAGGAAGDATNQLKKMQEQLQEAPGFTATAAIAMSLTALNQMKMVGNTLETVLIEAFQKVEPSVILVSRMLREAFASPEFASGIQTLVNSVMSLVTVLVENAGAIVTVAKLFAVYTAGTIGMSLGTAVASTALRVLGVTAATTAVGVIGTTAALTTVPAAAAAATTGVMLLNRAFGIIGVVVSVAAAAYYLFSESKKASDTDGIKMSRILAAESIDQMNKETERLEKTMELRRSGMVEQEIAASVAHSAARQGIVDNGALMESVVQLALEESNLVRTRLLANKFSPTTKGPALDAINGQVADDERNLARVREGNAKDLANYDDAHARMVAAAKKDAKEATAAVQSRRPTPTGLGEYDPDAKKGGKGKERRDADADYKNQLKKIELQNSAAKKLEVITDEQGRIDEARVTMKHARGLISEGDFQTAMTALADSQSASRIKMAQDEVDAIGPLLEELKRRADKLKAKGGSGVPERLQNDLDSMQAKLDDATQRIVKLKNDKEIRLGAVLTESLKPVTDLNKQFEKEAALDQEKIASEIEKMRIKGSGLELSDREQSIQSEILRILGKQREELVTAQLLMKQKIKDGTFGPDAGPDAQAAQQRLQDGIDARSTSLGANTTSLRDAAGGAFDNKRWEGYGAKISSSVESSIKDGLTGALTGDMSAIANFGKTLQKTVVGALVDAFYEAFVQDAVKDLGRSIASTLKAAIGSGGGGGGGGTNWLGMATGVASMFTGGAALGAANMVGAGGGDSLGALIALKGLSGGGFTGTGADTDVAGFVHANEFVINAKNTAKLPKSFLESLNGYADGGLVKSVSGPSMSSNPAGRIGTAGSAPVVFSPTTHVTVDSRSDRAAVIQDVQRVVAENQKQYTESLKRMKVIPG
ncbi:MAG: phage tail tape measure protein [Rhizobacter sp.]|nr:phage tail tape measure protein [Rhizobacter sp.]